MLVVEFERSVRVIAAMLYFVSVFSFALMILIKHEMIHESILMHIRKSTGIIAEYRLGSENPIFMCLFTSSAWLLNSAYTIKTGDELEVDIYLDSTTLPIIICSIVGITEFSTIALMIGVYTGFNLALEDIDVRHQKQDKIRIIASILFIVFYTVFYMGEAFNFVYGGKRFQFENFGLLLSVYDFYRMKTLGAHSQYDTLFRVFFRLLFVSIRFVKELEYE